MVLEENATFSFAVVKKLLRLGFLSLEKRDEEFHVRCKCESWSSCFSLLHEDFPLSIARGSLIISFDDLQIDSPLCFTAFWNGEF